MIPNSVCPYLSESILQRTDGLTGRVSREADLLPLLKRPCGNPVEVSITNPTPKAGEGRRKKVQDLESLTGREIGLVPDH